MAEKKKLNPVDLVGIGNLLEYLVAADNMIACEFASWIAPEFKMLLLKLSLR